MDTAVIQRTLEIVFSVVKINVLEHLIPVNAPLMTPPPPMTLKSIRINFKCNFYFILDFDKKIENKRDLIIFHQILN